ncbi:hypothetical protein NQZ68_012788 [Dissostichus eleginoides]|nr:hypothetical protein NQZ68_012788 [Dissostichus eleginoides]
MGTRTILRVIVHDGDTRKITLNEKPQTLESLVEQLEGKLGLQYKFCLQYEDPDFNDALVNLADSADLPEQPTIKILLLVPTPTPSTADTDTMSISSPESRSTLTRSPWPDNFEIPYFPVDIKYRLRHGNLLYMRDKKYLQVPRDMKHEILEKLAETIYSFKAYPVMKNTLMLQLLLFKNIHVSLNQAPPMDNMDSTFARRRREFVTLEPPVKDIMERWPALFAESQIVAEFCRVSSKNLKIEFFKELEKYTPHFFDIFKSKGGSVGRKLEGYLQRVAPAGTDVNGK